MEIQQQQSEILVTGSTGCLGRAVCKGLQKQGLDYSIATRRKDDGNHPSLYLNLDNGYGIREAVKDRRVILHLASDKKHPDNDVRGIQAILKEMKKSRSKAHLIYISIVGVDQVPMRYFKQKWLSEQQIAASGIFYSTLRATQFHEYINELMTSFLRWPIGVLPKQIPIQPIDVELVANTLVAMVEEAPLGKTKSMGGPEVLNMGEAAEIWMKCRNKNKPVLNLPFWGSAAGKLNSGALLSNEITYAGKTWEQWLGDYDH
jgi:uncharacterized protein YbjT (DUF2867 family)